MKYLFFVAFLRALEKQIPDETDFERMINALNLEEAFKILQDTYYGPYLMNFQSTSFEELFEQEHLNFEKILKRMGLEKKILMFLSLKADFFNLGIILKEEMFQIKEPKDVLLKRGAAPNVLRKKYSPLIKELKASKVKVASEIDDFLIKAYFQKLIELTQNLKEKKLEEFFQGYWRLLKQQREEKAGDLKELPEKYLRDLEKEFLDKTKWESEGLLPIFAFFLEREYSQKVLRIILSAKEIGLKVSEIQQLLGAVPALI